MKAWYFSGADKKLRYGDNRTIELGVTHEVEGDVELCENGLHASTDILDALLYAPGPIIYRVELSGDMDKDTDKVAAQHRKYLSGGINITSVLRKFARMCALDVIHLWDAPDVVVKYLKTGDAYWKEAAREVEFVTKVATQWDPASTSARDAAVAALMPVGREAANEAVRSASWATQWEASKSVIGAGEQVLARAKARKAIRKKQSARLERMVRKAIKEA